MEFLLLPNINSKNSSGCCNCNYVDLEYPECVPLYCGKLCMNNHPCTFNVCDRYTGPTPYSDNETN